MGSAAVDATGEAEGVGSGLTPGKLARAAHGVAADGDSSARTSLTSMSGV